MQITDCYGVRDLQQLNAVQAFENELLKLPQIDLCTEHIFNDGEYIRRITIPPNTALTGAAHKTGYHVRLVSGRIIVTTDNGVREFIAPCEFDAPAGTKRAGYTEDEGAVWEDVYHNPDNCTDLAVLEDRLYIVPEVGMQATRTEEQKARIDYMAFVHESGLCEQQIQRLVHFDNVSQENDYFVRRGESKIHGIGLFATCEFSIGEIICPASDGERRTIADRYTNHSGKPNAYFERLGSGLLLVAKTHIAEGDEITIDYRQALNASRSALQLRGAK